MICSSFSAVMLSCITTDMSAPDFIPELICQSVLLKKGDGFFLPRSSSTAASGSPEPILLTAFLNSLLSSP